MSRLFLIYDSHKAMTQLFSSLTSRYSISDLMSLEQRPAYTTTISSNVNTFVYADGGLSYPDESLGYRILTNGFHNIKKAQHDSVSKEQHPQSFSG
jgi:hypothetical protein